MNNKIKRNDLIYPELDYKIRGVLFEVFKEMGPGYQEKYYQRALAIAFEKHHIKYTEQIAIPLKYKDKKIGHLVLDFLIEDKVVLEIKKGDYFSPQNIKQIYEYLKATGLELGLLANFTADVVKVKRILNIK